MAVQYLVVVQSKIVKTEAVEINDLNKLFTELREKYGLWAEITLNISPEE